ncbi:nicotinamide/nicotinic acid mononucleotide adenylyltransferase 3-like isoform X2 [Planococcus citri]
MLEYNKLEIFVMVLWLGFLLCQKRISKMNVAMLRRGILGNPTLILTFVTLQVNGMHLQMDMQSSEMIREEIVLLLCGSFNPITNMHLRMLEIARDHLTDLGFDVKQAYISPVHDKYGKTDLISINHRINMIKNAIKSSDWIHLSTWESEQSDWTPTYQVLKHHQDRLNGLLINDTNINSNSSHDVNGNSFDYRVTVRLVCGGDVLNSFSVPGLWKESDIQGIMTEHGIACVTRCGYDLDKIIYENDRLFANKRHIYIVKEHIENTVSSTAIRKACLRGLSIKYLVQEGVEKYIKDHKLYSYNK